MNEWGVITVIAGLVGFIITVVKPIITLNTSITKLTEIVDRMGRELDALTSRNAATHQRIFDRIENHEVRLNVIEQQKGE